jgi:hypothetical protein
VPWYKCKACNTAFEVGTILTTNHWHLEKKGSWISCIACGGEAPYVLDTEETWWLVMEKRYQFSRPLLKQLVEQFSKQRAYPWFDTWLEQFLKQAESEEEVGN